MVANAQGYESDEGTDMQHVRCNIKAAEEEGTTTTTPKNRRKGPPEQAEQCSQPEPAPPIPFLRLACMQSFNFANGVLIGSYMILVLPLESQRIDDANRGIVLGGLMLIAGVSQLISPLVGLLSDRCMSSWGRRRPFLLGGGAMGVVGILMQDLASMHRCPIMYFAAFMFVMLSLNTAFTAGVGIVPDIVPPEQTGTATGTAALMAVAGANAGFLMYNHTSGSDDERLHTMYKTFMFVTATCTTLTILACKEVPLSVSQASAPSDEVEEEGADGEKVTRACTNQAHGAKGILSSPIQWKDVISSYYIDPRQHSEFALVFWSRTFYYVGVSLQTFFKYYLADVVGIKAAESATVQIAILGQLCAALTAIPSGLLSDHLGKVRKPFVYGACLILACGNIGYCFARVEREVFVIGGILGAANGVYLAMDAALALDTLPSGDEAARFMGVWGIGGFLGGAIGPAVGGPILILCGHNASHPEAYAYRGYAVIFGMAAFSFFISGVLLKSVVGAVEKSPAPTDKCACGFWRRQWRYFIMPSLAKLRYAKVSPNP